jgi:2-polyprenyl-3-methyl-5-hydroxy-6-metoxy-1,4-benzoquinol methylase
MSETEEIKRRYHERESSKRVHSANQHKTYGNFILQEREKVYEDMLRRRFNDFSAVKILEVGAGSGGNLNFFNKLGIPWTSIHANELLEERLKKLKKDFRMVNIIPGDALEIDGSNKFDIIFQSTVFTSILDQDFKERLARKMMSMLNADGIILWYDFIYNNPSNSDVRGVPVKEVLELFPSAKKVEIRKVTLAPPIGRRVGKLYPVFNKFTFLRTHIVATISF